jgi:predicted oxidoreductase
VFVPRRKLHINGPEISEIVYDVWKLREDSKGYYTGRVLEKIQACLDIGITTFENSDIYGNYACEEIFGNALRKNKYIYQKIEIITKYGIILPIESNYKSILYYNTSKKHLLSSVENSLEKLGVEKIDLLLLHRPDPLMNPEEVAETFRQLKQEGKVLYFGVTNFSAFQFLTLQSYLDFPLVTNQIELSPTQLNPFLNNVIELCLQLKIKPMAWTPFLADYILQSNDPRTIRMRHILYELSKEHTASFEEILLAWLVKHPVGIIPVISTNHIERLELIKDYRKINLSREDWFRIWIAAVGEELT